MRLTVSRAVMVPEAVASFASLRCRSVRRDAIIPRCAPCDKWRLTCGYALFPQVRGRFIFFDIFFAACFRRLTCGYAVRCGVRRAVSACFLCLFRPACCLLFACCHVGGRSPGRRARAYAPARVRACACGCVRVRLRTREGQAAWHRGSLARAWVRLLACVCACACVHAPAQRRLRTRLPACVARVACVAACVALPACLRACLRACVRGVPACVYAPVRARALRAHAPPGARAQA